MGIGERIFGAALLLTALGNTYRLYDKDMLAKQGTAYRQASPEAISDARKYRESPIHLVEPLVTASAIVAGGWLAATGGKRKR